ncbi:unnamed protein product [Zymoseptoria tritici ST99CH_1A5]|uniref:Helix-turn-helix domain-containing protein n=3 Tax=Zymoseptoria tritici TaxID=1047171 RepID=F9X877_ZYMTI|nr:uncharacterized protein MYCGRDRAFT_104020 [Zymoseptoria tritici IPO323]EGP88547.1 hypothetical protein MYCGRDRAFT_104020 [Zymoseptoria tritici IPO323]SMR50566.1 unnamed protein product [Zymoseptoria tritici ST99CH_1E4]SMY23266.1 unnamed protein product [Zymoseptoria tritici ST99CH_1A5]
MGSSASKATRAAGSAARQYPTRAPPTSQAPLASQAPKFDAPPQAAQPSSAAPPPPLQTQPGPTVKPSPHASGTRDAAINLDASDPDFAQSLRNLGPVQPNPTLSPSSAFPSQHSSVQGQRPTAPDPRKNPAVMVLTARSKLQEEAEAEFMESGTRGHAGRQFLDVYTIRQILTMRDEKRQSAAAIEKRLGLKPGVVERLGAAGVVALAQDQGRAQREINMV